MKTILTLIGALVALPVLADNVGLPADTPAAYKSECGGCHAAYPPALLGAADWKKIMSGLDKHFGTDASLDEPTRATLEKFLVGRAGRRIGESGGGEPRITASRWFTREHREVAAPVWRDPLVKSPANCGACHKGAEQGRYGERELSVPGMGRRQHDRDD